MEETKKMKHLLAFRVNKDVRKEINWMMQSFSDRFDSESHLIRCAIITLANKLKEDIRNEFK